MKTTKFIAVALIFLAVLKTTGVIGEDADHKLPDEPVRQQSVNYHYFQALANSGSVSTGTKIIY